MQLMPGNASGGQLEAMRLDSVGGVQVRTAMSSTSPGAGQLVARGLQVDAQTVTTTGAIAALASDTGLVRLTGAAPDRAGHHRADARRAHAVAVLRQRDDAAVTPARAPPQQTASRQLTAST